MATRSSEVCGPIDADKEKDNRIAPFSPLFHKLQFRAHWIGENGFESEAFALRQQFPSDLIRDVCGFIGFQSQLLGQFVCVYKAKAVRTQVSVIERALTGAVRPGQDQQNRSSFKNFHRARAAIATRALKGRSRPWYALARLSLRPAKTPSRIRTLDPTAIPGCGHIGFPIATSSLNSGVKSFSTSGRGASFSFLRDSATNCRSTDLLSECSVGLRADSIALRVGCGSSAERRLRDIP